MRRIKVTIPRNEITLAVPLEDMKYFCVGLTVKVFSPGEVLRNPGVRLVVSAVSLTLNHFGFGGKGNITLITGDNSPISDLPGGYIGEGDQIQLESEDPC